MASGCLGWYGPTRHGPGATIALVGRSDKDLGRAWALNGVTNGGSGEGGFGDGFDGGSWVKNEWSRKWKWDKDWFDEGGGWLEAR
ncbi:hypothetical protein V6N13_108582 [Hibiscus sabdariffa]